MENANILEPIKLFIQQIKTEHTPNLYTTLQISHPDYGTITITAEEIINLVKDLTYQKLSELKDHDSKLEGNGTKDAPYILNSPDAWLYAASNFQITPDQQIKYFSIGGQIVEIETQERKSSSKANVADSFTDELASIGTQIFTDFIDNRKVAKIALPEQQPNPDSIAAVLPLVFHFIQSIESKFNAKNTHWEKTAYSQLGKEHHVSQNYMASALGAMKPEAIDSIIPEMQSATIADSVIPLDKLPTFLGGFFDAYRNAISERGLLTEKDEHEFDEIKQKSVNFFSNLDFASMQNKSPWDVVDIMLNTVKKSIKEENKDNLSQEQENFLTTDTQQLVEFASNTLKENIPQIDLTHVQKLNKTIVISQIRFILANRIIKSDRYLPVTVAALFFSETSRHPICFIASLALLDLIQTHQKTPDRGEPYTLLNALVNPLERSEFVDAYGRLYQDNPSEVRKKLVEECIRFKCKDKPDPEKAAGYIKKDINKKRVIETQVNLVIPGKVEQNVAGYHPMVHGNSYNEVKKEKDKNNYQLNLVEQKIASILLQWLSLKLVEEGFETKLDKKFIDEILAEEIHHEPKKKLLEHINSLLGKRLATFDNLCTVHDVPLQEQSVETNNFNSNEAAEFDPTILESQRSITNIVVNGARKICMVVPAQADGNCGFTALRHSLILQEEHTIAEKIEREIFIDLVKTLYKEPEYTNFITAIFKNDNANNIDEWSKKFQSPGYWLCECHFRLLSYVYNLKFHMYYVCSESGETLFKPEPSYEEIYVGENMKDSITVNLAHISTTNLNNPDASLNHYEAIIVEPTAIQKEFITAWKKNELSSDASTEALSFSNDGMCISSIGYAKNSIFSPQTNKGTSNQITNQQVEQQLQEEFLQSESVPFCNNKS